LLGGGSLNWRLAIPTIQSPAKLLTQRVAFIIKLKTMKINDFLSELERDKLKLVASDKVTLEAVKKVILSAVYFDGTLDKKGIPDPQRNFCLAIASKEGATNEEIGAGVRAGLAATQLLELGFRELEKYAVEKVTLKEAVNTAR